MIPDMIEAFVLFIGLLLFYRWNEPKAREQDQTRPHQHGIQRGMKR